MKTIDQMKQDLRQVIAREQKVKKQIAQIEKKAIAAMKATRALIERIRIS